MAALIGIGFFLVGAVLALFATERLLEGLVGLSMALRLSAFAVGAVLSGLEAENIALLAEVEWLRLPSEPCLGEPSS